MVCFYRIYATFFVIGGTLIQSNARILYPGNQKAYSDNLINALDSLQREIIILKTIVAHGDDSGHENHPNYAQKRSSLTSDLHDMVRYDKAKSLIKKCGKALEFPFSRSYSNKRCQRLLKYALKKLSSKKKFNALEEKSETNFVDQTRSIERHGTGKRQIPVARKYLDSDKTYRLPYFLPKRYNWKENDFPRLDTFWYHGPFGYPVIF